MRVDSIDNRGLSRKILQIPALLEFPEDSLETPSKRILLGFTSNISQSGVALKVASGDDLSYDIPVKINIQVHKTNSHILPAKLVWIRDDSCGFKFETHFSELKSLLGEASEPPTNYICQNSKVEKFYLYINGQDVDSGKHEFFPYADRMLLEPRATRECIHHLKTGRNPENVENFVSAQYAVADSRMNQAAIYAAHKAFSTFKHLDLARRRKIIDDIRELLLKEKEKMIRLMIIEGHPRKLAEWEFSGMIIGCSSKSLDFFASEIQKVVLQTDRETMINVRRPEGVVCVSPPGNASCSNSLTAILALLAGNTLIVKPPLACPVSTIYLWRNIVARVLEKNGAPDGTVNIVVGNSKQFMEEWLESPYVRCILFFNDSAKGIDVGRKIFEKGKRPILELSGNDYLAIWKDASIEEAADSLLDCFMGSTQICMVPKKALVHESIYEPFIKIFLKKVRDLKIGLPTDPETIFSPVVKINEFFDHLNDAIENGATLSTGGKRVNHLGEESDRGVYLQPTVVEVPMERVKMMKCVREENFFPLLPVIKVTGGGLTAREKDRMIFTRMMDILESNLYGLRISVWVKDPYYLKMFMNNVHTSGLLRINTRHIGFSEGLSTHGGVGLTGGPFGEMNYVWQKTSHLQGITIPKTIVSPKEELSTKFEVIDKNLA